MEGNHEKSCLEEHFPCSLVDENKYYRSTITGIPDHQDITKSSGIPFVINVIMENYEEENIPLWRGEIIRCDYCKSYLNPFIEIIPPGLKWRCNICLLTNNLSVAFQVTSRGPSQCSNEFNPKINANYNYLHYTKTELRSTVYELVAPPNYSLKTPSPPFLCFLIEATFESVKNRTIGAVVRSILGGLNLQTFDSRSRMMFGFFDSSVYLLNRNGDIVIIPDATFIPFFLVDDFLLPLSHPVNVNNLEKFFMENKSTKNNYGDAIRVIQSVLDGNNGCILSFLTTHPNIGPGLVDPNQSGLRCKSTFYKELAAYLSKQAISVTQFLFPRLNMEIPTISVLSKYTGGMIYYYPNFDGNDPTFATKLANDLASHLDLNIGLYGVCRVRASKCVFIKEYFGSVHHRSTDLLAFSTFFPPHSFSFEVEVSRDENLKAVCFQVAILRTLRTGERRIRVLNFCIEKVPKSLYSLVDAHAIAHAFAMKAFFFEAQSKGAGNEYLNKSMKSIVKAYKHFANATVFLPNALEVLPVLMLSLCKSIPLRPSSYTPTDYKSYYIYLISNSYPKLVDTIIYPTLIALHKLDVIQPLNLTLNCLEMNGLYMLDTGVTIFFFVARDCDHSLPDLLFDPSIGSGRFIFDPEENQFSSIVCEIIRNVRSNRYLTPNYVLVRDDGSSSIYRDIFFTYFVEDDSHGLPSCSKYLELLKQSQ